jgi:pimeloyl-ACP methyl ester carboxylesterase
MKGNDKMEVYRILLKILMWILIAGFGCNFVMETISYSFYKGAKQMKDITFSPVKIQFNKNLTGYGCNLDSKADRIILFFGGSNYIAYNSVGKFGGAYDCPFISADFYGTQESKGKMNLKSIQQTSEDLYNWAVNTYPNKKIVIMGHSYGTGIAAYLASVKKCDTLVLLAAYRDLSDLYNKIIPIFWGPAKIFISNNILLKEYAKNTACRTYIIGSTSDKTLGADLQKKVQGCYKNAEIMIFDNVEHENYLLDKQVIPYVRGVIGDK